MSINTELDYRYSYRLEAHSKTHIYVNIPSKLDLEGDYPHMDRHTHWRVTIHIWIGTPTIDIWIGTRTVDIWIGIRTVDIWIGTRTIDIWIVRMPIGIPIDLKLDLEGDYRHMDRHTHYRHMDRHRQYRHMDSGYAYRFRA